MFKPLTGNDAAEGKPEISYRVSGDAGQLDVTQPGKKFHMGPTYNNWDLKLANDVPMELKVEMALAKASLKLAISRSPNSKSIWVRVR